MARNSKWIEVQSPDEPFVDVARRALKLRLRTVWRYLRRASCDPPSILENVHQLRVSTRRAVAALELFDQLLPSKRSKWMLKQLRKVRRAAGAARDLDVLKARFAPLATAEEDAHQSLLRLIQRERKQAQKPIDLIYKKLTDKDYLQGIKDLVSRTKYRTSEDKQQRPTFAAAARTVLDPLIQEFLAASNADFSDYGQLHAFRIQSKQLRYALEVFSGALSTSFRDNLYPLVASLQERLGKINDHVTAAAQFETWCNQVDLDPQVLGLLNRLVEQETSELNTSCYEFQTWWSVERRAELRAQFDQALNRIGAAPVQTATAQTLPLRIRQAE